MPLPAAPTDKWERERRDLSRQILAIARGSFAVVGLMPWWLPLARAYLPIEPVGMFFDALYVVICHRLPERTITLAGIAMPLCSRCAGIFTGLALGAITLRPRLRIKHARIALVAAGLLMLADVLMQDLGIHPVWHTTRLVTGALVGWVASAALMNAIKSERRLI